VGAPGALGDDLVKFAAPAQPAALGGGAAQVRLEGETAAEAGGHQREDLVQGRRDRDEIDDRVLDKRVRRQAGRLPWPTEARRPVHHNAVLGAYPSAIGDGDVHLRAALIRQAQQLGGGLVTQPGLRAGVEDGRPQVRDP
jgi:hypothetical protein